MRYATAVHKLRMVAEALAADARIAEMLGGGPLPIVAGYAFGALLEGSDPVEAAEVAFIVDRPGTALPWGVEPVEVRSFVERHRLHRFPLRWYCRPKDAPVGNHRIRRPVRIWSAEHGPEEAVLDALAARRLQDLPRLPEADAQDLVRQLEEEAALCLTELDALVHSGPVDARSIAVELFDLAWGYTDLRRALAELRGEPSPLREAQKPTHTWSMRDYEELRGAAWQGDGQAAVDLLGDRPLDEVAQLAGDALLVALGQG
ncbi:MAG: hypothetical protein M3O70_13060, partial [Actinomycetota bacterium]|nr:hypothetical protein [Actinomycetota bacterium]